MKLSILMPVYNEEERGREEGKKITWRDGVEALYILGRERARRVRPHEVNSRTP